MLSLENTGKVTLGEYGTFTYVIKHNLGNDLEVDVFCRDARNVLNILNFPQKPSGFIPGRDAAAGVFWVYHWICPLCAVCKC